MSTDLHFRIPEPPDSGRGSDPETRCLQLHDTVDALVAAYARSRSDAEDDRILECLAAATGELALTGPAAHRAHHDPQALRADRDDARFAALLADLADARVTGRPRRRGLAPEIEHHPYVAAMLEQMAGQEEQDGWVLAYRLNVLVDHALEKDMHTGLAQRLALAASCRPDGSNAALDEDDEQDAAATTALPAAVPRAA